MGIALSLIVTLILVLANGFFVAAEFSMVKVRRTRLETMANDGDKMAKRTVGVVDKLNAYLSACQLGITLASLGLGWIGEPAVSALLAPVFEYFNVPAAATTSISVIIGFSIITALHIVLGELVPKSLAIVSTEKIANYTALPLIIFYKVTYPIIWVFNKTTELILRIFGIKQVDNHDAAHTDEEIRLLVEDSFEQGLIDETEMEFVDNVIDFSDTHIVEVMIPKEEMVTVRETDSIDAINTMILEANLEHTRYPVYSEKDVIIGFIHIKDLYQTLLSQKEKHLSDIIRPIRFVPKNASISLILKTFQQQNDHLVMVNDGYGSLLGMATMEDILEEIVGEIEDEFDLDIDEENVGLIKES